MKNKCIYIVFFLFQCSVAYSQTESGRFFVGLSTDYKLVNSQNEYPSKTEKYAVGANINYMLFKNMSIGFGFEYGLNSTKTYFNSAETYVIDKKEDRKYSLNLKYFVPLGEKSFFTISVLPKYISSSIEESYISRYIMFPTQRYNQNAIKATNETLTPSFNAYGFDITPSFFFFPISKLGVEVSAGNLFGYLYSSSMSQDGKEKIFTREFEVLGVNTVGLGVTLYYFINK